MPAEVGETRVSACLPAEVGIARGPAGWLRPSGKYVSVSGPPRDAVIPLLTLVDLPVRVAIPGLPVVSKLVSRAVAGVVTIPVTGAVAVGVMAVVSIIAVVEVGVVVA